MKRKMKLQIGTDCAMTVLLLILMAKQLTGETAREWLGAGMFVLWVFHHVLNEKMVWPHSEGKVFSVPSGAVCCQCLPFCGHAWHNSKRRYSLPKGFRFSAALWRCGVCTALAHLLCFLGLCADGPAPWPALGNGCGLGAKNSRARFTQAGQIGAVLPRALPLPYMGDMRFGKTALALICFCFLPLCFLILNGQPFCFLPNISPSWACLCGWAMMQQKGCRR